MKHRDTLKRVLLTKTAGEPELTPRKSEVRTKPLGTPSRRGTTPSKEVDGDRDRRAPDFVEPSRKARLKEIFNRPMVNSK